MKPNYELKPAMEKLGIKQLRAHQIKPIQTLKNGKDTIVIAGTSSGKSIIYQIPGLLQKEKLTIVVEPTLALIYNQVQFLREHDVKADYLDHFRTRRDIQKIYNQIQQKKLTFLYVTPERLQSKEFREVLEHTRIHMLVIDECHCMTEWGYTFREAYLQIGDFVDCLPDRPVICACSATLTEQNLAEIKHLLHIKDPKVCQSDLKRENLILLKKDVTQKEKKLEKRLEKRFDAVRKCIDKYHKNGSVVIYALTTGYVDALFHYLNDRYPDQVARYHAQIQPQSLRHKMELDFLQGERKIMVATSAFGMGIDVPDIELVLHFNTPLGLTDYIQQIGRGGRDQKTRCTCVLFYEENGDDAQIVHSFEKRAKDESRKAAAIIKDNYGRMQEFIHSTNCMMQDVLSYQGQTEEKTCKCCTCCARKRRGG